ncbi:SUKH-3 domain-containing protein [Catellatospora vulcania]|uniref:SUKH-3 domain-containing protein n=1 Tax=Catellatospora vulcania TaxID=1460450 RepID=UPI0012D43C20|nr:SUKH-3 domain-containing protein [Catellatospora vulcania]
MISQERLQEIARHWAVAETLRRGYECEPRLTEFPGGWVVWSPRPAGGPVPEPGDGETVIIDRETGALTVVPGLPPQVAMSRYTGPAATAQAAYPAVALPTPPPGAVGTMPPPLPPTFATPVDPLSLTPGPPPPNAAMTSSPFGPPRLSADEQDRRAAALAARLARLSPGAPAPALPQVVATLEVVGRTFQALGHTADAEPVHHPAVLQALAAIPPGSRTRGAHRHPDLIVVSKALFELGGAAHTDPAWAARQLVGATLRLHLLREGTDPDRPAPAASCHTCGTVLVSLGMPGELPRDLVRPEPPQRGAVGRAALRAITAEAVAATIAVPGARHRLPTLPFLVDLLEPYAPFHPVLQSQSGAAQRVESFTLDVWTREQTADTLGDLAERLGARLFPIGGEAGGLHSILAVDQHHRVFAIDHAGAWYLGPTLDDAVQTLLIGRSTPRLRTNGTW